MNIASVKSFIGHYYCSTVAHAEDGLVAFLIVAFSALSLFPAQVLAYSEQANIGGTNQAIFRVPFGPIRDAALGKKTVAANNLQLTAGMYVSAWTSAYSSTVGQTDGDPFTTASGTQVHVGTAASNFLPLGAVISMNGSTFTIEDRMNTRYDNRYALDIWQPSQEAAFGFGVRLMTIQIVSLPD